MREALLIIFCVLFTTSSSTLGQDFTCPVPISHRITISSGCPDPFKGQRSRYVWNDNLDDEGLSYGRGKCVPGLECWPLFYQPTRRAMGSQGIYDLYYVVQKVDERTVIVSSSGSVSCAVFLTRTFEFQL